MKSIIFYRRQWTTMTRQLAEAPVGAARHRVVEDRRVLSVYKVTDEEAHAYLDAPQDCIYRVFVTKGARFGPPLLPPYAIEHVESFERGQQLRLTPLFRFYVTQVSREFILPQSRRVLVLDPNRQLGFNRMRVREHGSRSDCYFGDDGSLQRHIREGTLELGQHEGIVSIVVRGHSPGLALWSRDDRQEYGTGSLLHLFLLAGL